MRIRAVLAAIFLGLCAVSEASWADAPAWGLSAPVKRFYESRNWQPAWSGSRAAEAEAREAVAVLNQSASEGLDPGRYRVAAGGAPFERDVALSSAILTYMQDLSSGRPEFRSLDADVGLDPPSADLSALLTDAVGHHSVASMLASLSPKHPEYAGLKAALAGSGDKSGIISANMERWRWLPPVLEPDRIVVNAADAQLQLWLAGKQVLTSRVIVGKVRNRTPILRAEGAGVTINPPWTVPRSIAAKEILPKLKANHAYLASQDMVLLNGPPGDPHGLNVNWRAVRAGTFPYQIRQYPGPRNPLGRIKIELPNRFDVYLHDTPAKSAFARANRALSHGCVRVEQILPLASYALSGDLEATDKIARAVGAGDTQYLPLNRKLPVYFVYFTAIPKPDGTMQFRPDLYGRDRRLIAAMQTEPLRIAANFASCAKG